MEKERGFALKLCPYYWTVCNAGSLIEAQIVKSGCECDQACAHGARNVIAGGVV
jgi:hypothetical protein